MDFNKLQKLRKLSGVTQDELAKRIGVNRATISKYETGQIEPPLSQLQAIADALGVHVLDLMGLGEELDKYSITFGPSTDRLPIVDARLLYDALSEEDKAEFGRLATNDAILPQNNKAPSKRDEADDIANAYRKLDDHGKGAVKAILDFEHAAVVAERRQSPAAVRPELKVKKRSDGFVELKVYDQPAAAGLGNYLDEPTFRMEQYPANVIPDGTDFGIQISGDSMSPDIRNGSTAFVQSRSTIEPGKIGIFLLNDEAFCKKLVIDRDKDQIRLVSFNPAYPDRIIERYDDFHTLGLVLGHWPK